MTQSSEYDSGKNMVDLSVVFVTFNRSNLLTVSIERLRDVLESTRLSYELIIADDCSSGEHKKIIDEISNVKVVRTNCNSGLGANVNNGIAHANGSLILQLQDDWKWCGVTESFTAAINFIEENPDVGILQLTQVGTDLPVKSLSHNGYLFKVFKNDHIPWIRNCGVRPYSDQPHIKRREFINDLGAYLDGVPMTQCENEYKHRVANQNRWRVAMIDNESNFVHLGAAVSFNAGGRQNPLIRFIRSLPYGSDFVEPTLRNFLRSIDHLAAKLMAR